MASPPLLLCQHVGCSAQYLKCQNADSACRYHSGFPVFRDGQKTWGCCGARHTDFGIFMSLPGCALGRHTQDKPVAPPAPAPAAAPAVRVAAAAESATVAESAGGRASCARCRQGYFCSERHTDTTEAALPPPPPPPLPPPPPVAPVDPDAEQTCRNAGCGSKFRERDNADDACHHHQGAPIFHERQKGWACCKKVRLEWRGSRLRLTAR